MYGYQDGESGGAMKAVCTLIVLLLIGAVAAGMFLGGSELFSPSVHEARAEKLEAEAAARRAETAYEERQRRLEMDEEEQKAAVEVQALRERRAIELELIKPLTIVGMVVGSIVALTLTAAIAYYYIAQATAVRGEGQSPAGKQPVHYSAGLPPSSRQGQGAARTTTPGAPVAGARVHPDDVSYDGCLAYVYDHGLHPDRAPVFYPRGLVSEVENVYVEVLTRARIIVSGRNGGSGWTLAPGVRRIEDVKRGMSRHEFYNLANAVQRPIPVGPQVYRDVELPNSSPALWNS